MVNTSPSPAPLTTGSNGAYQWLTTERELDLLLQVRPEAVLGKFLAVTSIDSGFLLVDEKLRSAGWESRKNIAYSPRIRSVERLPHGGYDEWYVFETPVDLGEVFQGNVFEAPLQPGQVSVFVNYGGFTLHDTGMRSLVDLFWKQLEWINPESYLAEGSEYLTFVSRNRDLFMAACEALNEFVD